jgi:hypothetical protein
VVEAEEVAEFVGSLFCGPVDQVGIVRCPAVVVVSETGGRDDGDAACRPREAEDEVACADVEVAGGDEQQRPEIAYLRVRVSCRRSRIF